MTQQKLDVQNTIEEGKQLWTLVSQYAKLEVVEKLTSLITMFILGGILFAVCSIALYCFCMYLVTLLATQTDNLALSYAIVGFALLLVGFLVYWFRKDLIIRPVIKTLMKEYFEEKTEEDDQSVETDDVVLEQTEE